MTVCNLGGSSVTVCWAGFYMLTLQLPGRVQKLHLWDNLCGEPASSPVLQAFTAGQRLLGLLSLPVARWLSSSRIL